MTQEGARLLEELAERGIAVWADGDRVRYRARDGALPEPLLSRMRAEKVALLSALGQPEARGRGLVMEGVFLGVHYAFLTWPFRKLYMEASEESHQAFGSGLGLFFAEEGRLREHTFWNGRWADVVILAVYRDGWSRHAERLLDRFVGAPMAESAGAVHSLPSR